jgi:glycosyltransferase involved in cell wall biosynthesis
LRAAIRSVFEQTKKPEEIICVDDGSLVDVASVVREFPGVVYIRQENKGASAARNNGMKRAVGEFLIFLDSDDLLLPHAIEVGLDTFKKNSDVALVFGRAIPIDLQGNRLMWNIPRQPEVATYGTLLSGDHIIAPAGFMVRRSIILAAGGFNEEMRAAEECDAWRRVAKINKIHFHGREIFQYRIHGGNISSNASTMLRGALLMHSTHLPYVQSTNDVALLRDYERGRRFWIKLYGPNLAYELYARLKSRQYRAALADFTLMIKYWPVGFLAPIFFCYKKLCGLRNFMRRKLRAP